jgi:hypothetical protein
MAKQTHKLTDLKIKALKKPGLHGDGDGLYLKLSPHRDEVVDPAL